jgi:hypothetical protein
MVLSDTEAVRSGVIIVVGRVVGITGKGVAVAVVTVIAGCAGGASEHPLVRRNRSAMRRSTGIDLIDAGRSFLYNKMMVPPEAWASYACITVPAGHVSGGIYR